MLTQCMLPPIIKHDISYYFHTNLKDIFISHSLSNNVLDVIKNVILRDKLLILSQQEQ